MRWFKSLISYASSLKIQLLGAMLASVPLVLVFVMITLPGYEAKIVQNKRTTVKVAVESIFSIMSYYHKKAERGECTEDFAKAQAASLIKDLRHDEQEYFWIHDLNLKMVMHPMKPELDGTDISKSKDPKGKFLFADMNELVKKEGAGYTDYMWPKPGEKEAVPKTSFVKLFKPWGWVVGNGVYADDVEKEVGFVRAENRNWLLVAIAISIFISLAGAIYQLIKLVIPIQNVISSLRLESGGLFESAQGLKVVSEKLNDAGDEQANSVTGAVSMITEMNSMIEQTNSSAQQSSHIADQTKNIIKESLRAIEALNHNILEIGKSQELLKKTVDVNVDKMQELVTVINKVSDKTQVINDIVFQTKLLSFNASVEAARAGEFGKGFAVVAEEVGNLAQMSGGASAEISSIVQSSNTQVVQLTNGIKNDLNRVIAQVSETVAAGVHLSEKSLKMLSDVVRMATESSEMAGAIRVAADEQSKGSHRASVSLNSIDESTQQMRGVVRQTEQISEALLSRAQQLNSLTTSLSRAVGSTDKKAA